MKKRKFAPLIILALILVTTSLALFTDYVSKEINLRTGTFKLVTVILDENDNEISSITNFAPGDELKYRFKITNIGTTSGYALNPKMKITSDEQGIVEFIEISLDGYPERYKANQVIQMFPAEGQHMTAGESIYIPFTIHILGEMGNNGQDSEVEISLTEYVEEYINWDLALNLPEDHFTPQAWVQIQQAIASRDADRLLSLLNVNSAARRTPTVEHNKATLAAFDTLGANINDSTKAVHDDPTVSKLDILQEIYNHDLNTSIKSVMSTSTARNYLIHSNAKDTAWTSNLDLSQFDQESVQLYNQALSLTADVPLVYSGFSSQNRSFRSGSTVTVQIVRESDGAVITTGTGRVTNTGILRLTTMFSGSEGYYLMLSGTDLNGRPFESAPLYLSKRVDIVAQEQSLISSIQADMDTYKAYLKLKPNS